MPEPLAPPAERGHLEIRPRVVERVGRRAAREVPGVVPTSVGRLRGRSLPDVGSRVERHHVHLEVDLAVGWGWSLATVCTAVQQAVTDRVEQLTGMVVDAVDVTVEAVVVPADSPTRRVR